ncbi:MAG: hypothetical protein WDZ49_01460 [Litorilinea sp.]
MSALLEHLRRPSVTNEPPTAGTIRRNDVATLIWVAFVLVLGFGIRNNALSAGKVVTLGDDLLQITLPAGWVQGTRPLADAPPAAPLGPNEYAVSVWNSRSPSQFDATIDIHARHTRPGDNLATVRAALGLRRSQELSRYRELQAEAVTVLNLVPGTLITYAHVADPTRSTGALAPPVVVQGQDLIFLYREHVFRITVAADLATWETEATGFDRVFRSLSLRAAAVQEVLP